MTSCGYPCGATQPIDGHTSVPARRASWRQVRMVLFAAALLALQSVAGPAGRAAAQTLSAGTISGSVRDSTGFPLGGVIITLTNRANGRQLIVRSSRTGDYGGTLLEPGSYDVLFERLGFAPHLVAGVVVSAATRRVLSVELVEASGTTLAQRASRAGAGSATSAASGPARWFTSREAASLPFETEGVAALLRTTSFAGTRHDIEGLPASLHGTVLDGVPLVTRPRAFDVFQRAAATPLAYLSQAEVVHADADVEYPGAGAGYFAAHTRSGGRGSVISGFGDYGSDALAVGATDPAAFTSYRAGTVVQGAIRPDTAMYAVGIEVLRSRVPFSPFWAGDTAVARLVTGASAEYGVDLGRLTDPGLATLDRESAFGRFDFNISSVTSISVRGFFAQIPQPEPVAPWTGSPPGSSITPRGREILASATLLRQLDDEITGEVNVGFEASRAADRPADERDGAPPATTVVAAAHAFGSADTPDLFSEVQSFYLRGTLHIRSGTHVRKLGLMAWLPQYNSPMTTGRRGRYVFADVPDFRSSFGFYRGFSGALPPDPEFSLRKVAVFAQDAWQPGPGVEILAGARLTAFNMPDSSDITLAANWANLTGVSNRRMPGRSIEVEPRFQIILRPGGRDDIELRGGVMVDSDFADPGLISEILSNIGGLTATTGWGNLGRWPDAAGPPSTEDRGVTVTVAGPEYRGPRTTRAFGGATLRVGALAVLGVHGSWRRTEFLPRRKDLNLQTAPSATDQFGRPIWGSLRKRRGLLIAVPDSNRRFGGFEHVWGLEATGQSDYMGVTVTAERPLPGPFAFFGSYTWSQTEDDWLMGTPGDPFSQLNPFPDSIVQADWHNGRSDLDVPHRIVLGAELRTGGRFATNLAALFRYQSGYPFTPGFRPGVDANADGAENDPAFIDTAVPGMSGLLSAWPCLQDDEGGFAARNACRGPAIRGLDARLAVTLRQNARYSATFVVDALNLIASEDGVVDRAVYLVDPQTDLSFDPATSTVTVPLTVNPEFGRLSTRYTPQRQLRLGLRLSF